MVSLTVTPSAVDSPDNGELESHGLDGQPHLSSAHYFTKMLELYEIGNHIMLSQTPARSSFGDKFGLPRLYGNDESFGTVVKLENCLIKWESTLPQSLRPEIYEGNIDEVVHRQAVILRLR